MTSSPEPGTRPDGPFTLAFVGYADRAHADRASAFEDEVLALLPDHGARVLYRGRRKPAAAPASTAAPGETGRPTAGAAKADAGAETGRAAHAGGAAADDGGGAGGAALPHEVHLLWFPSKAALAAYMADERRQALLARYGEVFSAKHAVEVDSVDGVLAPPL